MRFWTLLMMVALVTAGCGRQSPEDLMENLSSPNADIRKKAAFKLADYGEEAAVAVPALIKALDDEDSEVVIWSMHALGEVGPAAKDAVPRLQEMLNDKDWNLRNLAKYALERIGEDSVPAVVEQLRSSDRNKRKEAAELLVDLGEKAVPHLRKAVKDDDYKVRYWSAHVLGEVDPDAPETLEIMNSLRKDKSSAVREKATEVLEKIGKKGRGTTGN